MLSNMQATALIRRRVVVAADAFAEVVIWRVPQSILPSSHMFKYRLAYVVQGECVVRYDNEFGKGDHRHYGSHESTYVFSTADKLMSDFHADILRWNDEHGRS